MRKQQQLDKDEIQRQAEQSRRATESEAGRIQRRMEAEMADLRATSSRLEVDLMKVSASVISAASAAQAQRPDRPQANKSKAQELQAARGDFDSKLASQVAVTVETEERLQEVEKKAQVAEQRAAHAESSLGSAGRHLREREGRLASSVQDAQQVGLGVALSLN